MNGRCCASRPYVAAVTLLISCLILFVHLLKMTKAKQSLNHFNRTFVFEYRLKIKNEFVFFRKKHLVLVSLIKLKRKCSSFSYNLKENGL